MSETCSATHKGLNKDLQAPPMMAFPSTPERRLVCAHFIFAGCKTEWGLAPACHPGSCGPMPVWRTVLCTYARCSEAASVHPVPVSGTCRLGAERTVRSSCACTHVFQKRMQYHSQAIHACLTSCMQSHKHMYYVKCWQTQPCGATTSTHKQRRVAQPLQNCRQLHGSLNPIDTDYMAAAGASELACASVSRLLPMARPS